MAALFVKVKNDWKRNLNIHQAQNKKKKNTSAFTEENELELHVPTLSLKNNDITHKKPKCSSK